MGLSFREKFKAKALQKQEEQKQIENNNYLIESCKTNFEAFKLRTSACQAKIGKIEESVETTENASIKTTTIFTEYGPITKKEIYEQKEQNGRLYVNNYINYEGYVAPKREVNELGEIVASDIEHCGYFNITTKKHYLANPVERETTVITHYKGTQLDCNGNVSIIQDVESSKEESKEWNHGSIVKFFEKNISDIKAKQSEAQNIKQ